MSTEQNRQKRKRQQPTVLKSKPVLAKELQQVAEEDSTGKTIQQAKGTDWSPQDLQELLDYFKKNGWNGDWDVIFKAFPMHTPTSLKTLLYKLGRSMWVEEENPEGSEETSEASTRQKVLKAPVEEWLTFLFPSRAWFEQVSDLPRILELISKYEKHPAPEDCGGVDYAAIYKYLAALQQGHVPQALNPASAKKVLEMLHCVVDIVRDKAEFFQSTVKENAVVSSNMKLDRSQRNKVMQSRRREEWNEKELKELQILLSGDIRDCLEILLQRPGFNPLNFSPTLQQP